MTCTPRPRRTGAGRALLAIGLLVAVCSCASGTDTEPVCRAYLTFNDDIAAATSAQDLRGAAERLHRVVQDAPEPLRAAAGPLRVALEDDTTAPQGYLEAARDVAAHCRVDQ